MGKITIKNTKRTLVDEATGERLEAQEVIQQHDRKNFEIAYISALCGIMNKLGGKRYAVLSYIIENKNTDNQLIITTKELALKAKTSEGTVVETIKLLRECGAIKTRTGAIMVLPKVAMQGNAYKEQNLMIRFREFQTDEQIQKEQEKKEKAENIIKELSTKSVTELSTKDLIKLAQARELIPNYKPTETQPEPTEASLF